MSLLLEQREIALVIGLIFGLLALATTLFWILGKAWPQADTSELKLRTRSWWMMAVIFVLATILHPVITFLSLALLSFIALRELASISKHVRDADRSVLIWCFLAIPIQYYFAYIGHYGLFLIFIPVVMYIWIPFMLVVKGETEDISRSMSVLPSQLIFTVFAISHLAFLVSLPGIPGFEAGGRGLLLFIVFITELNDVLQFTWGKLLGRYPIVPKVSPGKTWEGLIGGVITTMVVGYFLRFLTPFSETEVLITCGLIAVVGFIGDVIVSAIKRDLGVKDTGRAIPGHGGILDRIDSLAPTGPVFFHIVYNLYYV